jgi:hypothetical protein
MMLVAGKQDGNFLFKNCRDFPAFRQLFANFFPNREKIIVGNPEKIKS